MKLTDIVQTVQVPVNITAERLSDLLCNAIEGGSNYWCTAIDRNNATREQAEYRNEVPFVEGGFLTLDWCDNDEGEKGIKKIDLDAVKKGLTVFAEKCPRQFADFIAENDGAETGDCFLQCIVFGEVVYG